MKKLPKRFAVRVNTKSDLFKSFLNWFNGKYGTIYRGPIVHKKCIYGFDGTDPFFKAGDSIQRIPKNISYIFTLKAWNEIVNSKKFENGDKVSGICCGTTRRRKGTYIGKHPHIEDRHILFDGTPFVAYNVSEPTLDGEFRVIDGHKYKLKLVE